MQGPTVYHREFCSMLPHSLDGEKNLGDNGYMCIMAETLCHPHETVTTLLIVYQLSSVAQFCLTLCNPMNCSTPSLPVHHHLLEFTQTHVIESVMPSSHLILCHPLLLLPPIPPSIRVFSKESTLRMRWHTTQVWVKTL